MIWTDGLNMGSFFFAFPRSRAEEHLQCKYQCYGRGIRCLCWNLPEYTEQYKGTRDFLLCVLDAKILLITWYEKSTTWRYYMDSTHQKIMGYLNIAFMKNIGVFFYPGQSIALESQLSFYVVLDYIVRRISIRWGLAKLRRWTLPRVYITKAA